MTEQARDIRRILIGLVAALVLTAVPFGAVASNAVAGDAALALIAVAAALQIGVHLRFFLRLGLQGSPHETLLAIGFACVLVAIMLGGSLWIMSDLHQRMMP